MSYEPAKKRAEPSTRRVRRLPDGGTSWDYEGFLRLAMGQNNGGGGQAFLPSLTDALDVTIQGVVHAA